MKSEIRNSLKGMERESKIDILTLQMKKQSSKRLKTQDHIIIRSS